MIVRSNGTVTYVGKDIAYHLWKFGLLPGKDFYYDQISRVSRSHLLGFDRRCGAEAIARSSGLRPRRTRSTT